MNSDKKVEILAPAGSIDICKAVIRAGADAVYLGGDMFGARAYAGNLGYNEMIEAIEYAHRFNRKIYLTVNTLLKEDEINGQLVDFIKPYYEAGLDAVIVQDLGVLNVIRQHFPDMDIHASTQMTQTGKMGSRLLYESGASRIVTSRELTLDEIKDIHKECPGLEIESFVHGALCYCYSGQCLLSSFNGGRSGNRGRCAQPCRMSYITSIDGENVNSRDNRYALSPKDMCALDILPDIIEAGVYSLKIEGRMKNVTYASFVTSIYRKYVDMYLNGGRNNYSVEQRDVEMLKDVYNRGSFTKGWYVEGKGMDMMSSKRPNHQGTMALEVVDNVQGKVTFKALNDINPQDVFEIDREHSFESGSAIPCGGKLVVNLPKKYNLNKGAVLFRTKNAMITKYVQEKFVDSELSCDVSMYFYGHFNQKLQLTVTCGDTSVTVYGETVGEALKQPVSATDIEKQLRKTGGTYYKADDVIVDISENIFISVGQIKNIRRDALEQLDKALISHDKRIYESSQREDDNNCKINIKPDITVMVKNNKALNSIFELCLLNFSDIKRVYIDYTGLINFSVKGDKTFSVSEMEDEDFRTIWEGFKKLGVEIYFALPHILTEENRNKFEKLFDYYESFEPEGYLVRNIEELSTISRILKGKNSDNTVNSDTISNRKIVTDAGMYIFNSYSVKEIKNLTLKCGFVNSTFTLPYELNNTELKSVATNDTELVVYGRVPLMISKQCVRKTYEHCDNCNGVSILTDEKGKIYNVKSQCGFCYTLMEGDTFDISYVEEIKDIKSGTIRYEIENEDISLIKKILNGESSIKYFGHFYRGVN
ncbi:MAG: U32 family peptidase [Eubacteriales bacterium]|nr:U32 family peptidase [Eubacteriales bacterium]